MGESSVLAGRAGVLIGGASGIGEGLAGDLARRGMRLVIADIDGERADRVAAHLRETGTEAHSAQVDATHRDSLAELAAFATDRLGGVNLMASTVGAVVDRRLEEATDEDWSWMVELNLMAHVRTVDAFRPLVRRAEGYRHLMVTSSTAGLMALGKNIVGLDNGLYTATKYALVGYAEMLRIELEPDEVGVSVLVPSFIEGRLSETSSRFRPNRFGGTFTTEKPTSGLVAMPADEAGRIIAQGLEEQRFFLCTEPSAVAFVKRRHKEVVAAFEAVGPGTSTGAVGNEAK